MPEAKETTTLKVDIELGASAAEKSIAQFNKGWAKGMRQNEKASQKAMKGTGKAIAEFMHKSSGAHKRWAADIEKADAAYQDLGKSLEEVQARVADLNEKIAIQHKIGTDASKAVVTGLKKELAERERTRDVLERSQKDITASRQEVEQKFTFNTDEITEAGVEAGKAIASPFTAIFHKDVPEAAGIFAKLITKGIQKAGGSVGDVLTKKLGQGGDKLLARSVKMGQGGKAAKAGGAAMGLMGKGMKGTASAMGPLVGALSKLGPILGMAAASIAGIVKLLIDAEGVVKEINKEVLATASTSGFLAGNFGNAAAAATDLKETLRDISDAALDARSNLDWSITKEQHTAVLSSLSAEGVTIKTLEKEYGALNAQSKEYSDSFGSITQMAVTYSRQMGVSLQEITSLQGEMMTEMGSSLRDTMTAFRMINKEAVDSGISSNKFFSIIRGVSADLSLYNTRLEDSVKLLGRLGKIMSPRNAQQFMQFAMNAVKGMGRMQRLQTTLLAGGDKVAAIVKSDIEDKTKSIAKQIADQTNGNAADLEKAIKAGDRKTISEAISKAAPEAQGALTEAVSRLGTEKKRAGKGVYGVAQAAGMVTPGRQISIIDAALSKWGEPGDIGYEQMAENMGISIEQLEAMETMKDTVKDQRDKLVAAAKVDEDAAKAALKDAKVTKDAKKIAAAEKKLSEASGKVGKLQTARLDEIYDTLDATTRQGLEDDKKAADEEAKFAKEQGKNTFTIMDKLGTLVDWFMGQFYDAFLDLLAKFDVGDAAARKADRAFLKEQKAKGSKDPDIQAALKAASQADPGKAAEVFRDALLKSPTWTKMATFMETPQTDPKEEAKRLDMIKQSVDAMNVDQLKASYAISKGVADFNSLDTQSKAVFEDALLGDEKKKFTKNLTGGDTATFDQLDEVDKNTFYESLGKSGGVGAGTYDKLTGALGAGTTQTMAAKTGYASGGSEDQFSGIYEGLKGLMDVKPKDQFSVVEAVKSSQMDAKAQQAKYFTQAPEFFKAGVDGNSLSVHDHHVEKLLKKALLQKGIKVQEFDDHVETSIHDAVLKAARTALVEYYMYKDLNKSDMVDAMQRGVDPTKIGSGLIKAAQKTGLGGKNDSDPAALKALPLAATASGGLVTGITDGLARVRAAPGEGLASVGPGETIVPAGGGGGGGGSMKVELSLKGDLARIIDARADDRYAANRSKEKTR